MKKHKLIKHAYDKYPEGTKFKSLYFDGEVYESNGLFEMEGESVVTPVRKNPFMTQATVYCHHIDKWAEIVKPTVDFDIKIKDEPVKNIACHSKKIDGKVAIQVNNEREHNLLMGHFKQKGWHTKEYDPFYKVVLYQPDCDRVHCEKKIDSWKGYPIVPFTDFAVAEGITIPKFIMKSEDGVDMYAGDGFWGVAYRKSLDRWELNNFHKGGSPFVLSKNWNVPADNESNPYIESPSSNKAFSTREAAEAWIAEQNKPKEIIVSEESSYPIKVTKEEILVMCQGLQHDMNIVIAPEELEDIYEAYKKVSAS